MAVVAVVVAVAVVALVVVVVAVALALDLRILFNRNTQSCVNLGIRDLALYCQAELSGGFQGFPELGPRLFQSRVSRLKV